MLLAELAALPAADFPFAPLGASLMRVARPLLMVAGLAVGFGYCFYPRPATHVLHAAPEPPAAPAPDRTFETKVVPFLTQYCTTCHNDKKMSAGLDLAPFASLTSAQKDRDTWLKVQEHLAAKTMPPKNKPQPAPADRDLVAKYVESVVTKIDCGLAKNPGRVTLRRLNRAEYNNTIRDLVGVDFQPAADFPNDDVGYGFDNIGDVLSLSPILLEKYLAAAEQVVNKAIIKPDVVVSSKQLFRAQNLIATQREFKEAKRINLHSNGAAFIAFTFPADGDYTVRVKAWAQQAGTESAKMAVQLDGKEVKQFEVKGTEDKPQSYEVQVTAKESKVRVGAAFLNDFYDENAKDPAQRDRNLSVLSIEIEGPAKPFAKPVPESHRRVMLGETAEAGARRVLTEFARKAWRRPVASAEVDRLMKLVALAKTNGEPFEEQIKLALRAVLVSPNFLFRVERDRPGEAIYPVSDFEFASRLSYFLWASMPDDELFKLAEQGKLREKGVLEGQVRRMLKDAKAKALTENFAAQWLNLRLIQTVAPDQKTYPAFDPALRSAMVRESELFFEHIAREDRSVLEFLDADYTFVNERLARHYVIDGVTGPEFRKVKLPDARRGGVVTQASVLTLTSNPTRTSPVKRGKWVLENILGTPPPPPPPDAGELKEEKELAGSLRQRLEQHRVNPACATCHQRMDPLGFGLENFDGVGRWRSEDGKHKIDAAGTLPDGATFNGPAEMRKVLLGKAEQFRKCLSEKLLTYALGRGLESYDHCSVEEIVTKLKLGQDKFPNLVLAIVESEPFQKRRSAVK